MALRPQPVRVLGIDVDEVLVAQWSMWLMPPEQPFVMSADLAEQRGWRDDPIRLTAELRDAFELYGVAPEIALVWLTRSQAAQLPHAVRRVQPAAHRWPTSDPARDVAQVVRYVESGRRPSRHLEVTGQLWNQAESMVPGARRLAGTFADHSGPNCFGTVMAAAGIAGADREWMQTEPFESWLAGASRPGGRDDHPGTVLVWRDRDGVPTHAAITLGEGWLLHKPSQGWMSPIKVLSVPDGKFSARTPERHLNRYRLT